MTREEMCREFCELNEIHWHKWEYISGWGWQCKCGYDLYGENNHTYKITRPTPPNPNFPDAKSILEVMMKRKDFISFLTSIDGRLNEFEGDVWIKTDYIFDSDKLLSAAFEWCREYPI